MAISKGSKVTITAVTTAMVTAAVAAGIAFAAIPNSSSGIINACYATGGATPGALRVIDAQNGQACGAGEAPLSWDAKQLSWRGPWSASTAYAKSDVVAFQGSSYLALQASTNVKPTNAATWALLARKGAAAPASLAPLPQRVAELNWYTGRPFSGASYGFNAPDASVFDGAHLWIANSTGNSVTEVDPLDGSWVKTLSGGSYGFTNPDGLAFDGTNVWVANAGGEGASSVTEFSAANGAWIRTLTAGQYIFDDPSAMSFDGTHLWIAETANVGVTEINVSDGSLVRVVTDLSYQFNQPTGIAFDGTDIWVANQFTDKVTVLRASDAGLVGVGTPGGAGGAAASLAFDGTHMWVAAGSGGLIAMSLACGLGTPPCTTPSPSLGTIDGVAFDGNDVWATSSSDNRVTRVNIEPFTDCSGSACQVKTTEFGVRVFAGGDNGFSAPRAPVFDGTHTWVVNETGNSITELPSNP